MEVHMTVRAATKVGRQLEVVTIDWKLLEEMSQKIDATALDQMMKRYEHRYKRRLAKATQEDA
jgi:hypothetical protein